MTGGEASAYDASVPRINSNTVFTRDKLKYNKIYDKTFKKSIISQTSTTAIWFGGMNAAESFPFILCGFIINEPVWTEHKGHTYFLCQLWALKLQMGKTMGPGFSKLLTP